MSIKYAKIDIARPSQICPNGYFWSENIQSGNPGLRWKKCYHQLKDEFESYKLKREFSTPEPPSRRILMKSAELDEEEIQNLKSQIGELRNRLSAVQNQGRIL
jgi:hypothetical protein